MTTGGGRVGQQDGGRTSDRTERRINNLAYSLEIVIPFACN